MYLLVIKGARNSTLAYHRCESQTELEELLAIYTALGYPAESLIVQEIARDEAA
jgi:hypothetical protein